MIRPREWVAVAFLAVALLTACGRRGGVETGERPLPPGDHERTVVVDGIQRFYVVHVPPGGGGGSAPLPLVLAFHGGGGEPRQFQESAGLDQVADREGFLVVYPAGTGPRRERFLTWNAGEECCGVAFERRMDDVAFTRTVVSDLTRVARVDRSRVYATGHSNGAMMAYRIAAEAPDLVAAIAPVGGAMRIDEIRPTSPVPLLHIHSVDDPRALYEGGLGPPFPLTDTRVQHAPVEEGLERWREVNGCSADPSVAERRPVAGGTDPDGHRAERHVWEDCRTGASLELWKLFGPGHAWPGAEVGFLQRRLVGPETTVVVGAEEIWHFFLRAGT